MIKLHYFDIDSNIIECSGRKITIKKKLTCDPIPFNEKPENVDTFRYIVSGAYKGTDAERITQLMDKADNESNQLRRMRDVVVAHDNTLAPLIAEAKTKGVAPSDVLKDMLENKTEALDVSPDLSNFVTKDKFHQLETRVENFISSQQPASPSLASTQEIDYNDHAADIKQLKIDIQKLEKEIEILRKQLEDISSERK